MEKATVKKESSSSEKNIHAHKDVIKEETVCTQDKSDDPKIIETVKNELEAFNQVFNVLRGNSLLAEALEEETPVENKHGKLKQSETVPEVYVSNDDDDDVVYLIKKNELLEDALVDIDVRSNIISDIDVPLDDSFDKNLSSRENSLEEINIDGQVIKKKKRNSDLSSDNDSSIEKIDLSHDESKSLIEKLKTTTLAGVGNAQTMMKNIFKDDGVPPTPRNSYEAEFSKKEVHINMHMEFPKSDSDLIDIDIEDDTNKITETNLVEKENKDSSRGLSSLAQTLKPNTI